MLARATADYAAMPQRQKLLGSDGREPCKRDHRRARVAHGKIYGLQRLDMECAAAILPL